MQPEARLCAIPGGGGLAENGYLKEKVQGRKIHAHVNLEKGERSELAELASNLL